MSIVDVKHISHVALKTGNIEQQTQFYTHMVWLGALEVPDFSYLARQADHLMQHGYVLLYGPGRHGLGQNQFEYFRNPEANLIEFMCDLQQIWDKDAYVPRAWSSQERWVKPL